jgi:probable HAF family extracellular repeat protein
MQLLNYSLLSLGSDTFPYGISTASAASGGPLVIGTYFAAGGGVHGFLDSGGTITTLDDPLAAPGGTFGHGINSTGTMIVGSYPEHGFIYTVSTNNYATFDYPGAAASVLTGVNDFGQLVGSYTDNIGGRTHGFLYSPGLHAKLISLDDPQTSSVTVANGINNAGQVVGSYEDSGGGRIHGFLYSGGSYTTLDDPEAGPSTVAEGINSSGQIVGYYVTSDGHDHGFLYSRGTYVTIDIGSNNTFATGINDAGQIVGYYGTSNGNIGFLASPPPITAQEIQGDYLAITRTSLPLDQATAEAALINTGTTTEGQYVNDLLAQVADTTIPAVAVEGSMYNAVGSSTEITKLATLFLPAQVANAIQNGFHPQVYASEALGLAFAFGDENGGTAFALNFGPANTGMPATAAGDAAFAAAAASAIFGSAATANTPGAILGFVTNWEAFYTSHGIPGIASPNVLQIDLAARGAAWGDAVGVALENNLGPLPGQVTNFLEDAAQATAIYSASLATQPTAGPFHAATTGSAAGAASSVPLIGVAAPADHALVWAHDV